MIHIRHTWLRLVLLAALLLGAAQDGHADLFAEEIDADPDANHYDHIHDDELNRNVDGISVDAGCDTLPDPNCPSFRRAILQKSDFTSARFDGADWSFGLIVDVLFDGASFIDADLDDIYLERVDMTDADLSGADLRRATVRGGDFERANFTDARLRDSQWRCVAEPDEDPSDPSSACPRFVEADFTRADLTGALIALSFVGDQIPLSAASFREAILVDTVWAAIDEPCLQTDADLNLWDCLVVGSGDPAAPDATVEGLLILDQSDLRGSDWRNLTLRDFELPGAHIGGARFDGTTIEEADFTSSSSDCRAEDQDSLCDYFDANGFEDTSFAGAQLSDTDFSGADLTHADFTDATLTRVVFDGIDIGCNATPPSDPAACDGCCDDCVNFAGAFDGQTAQPDGAFNISAQNIDWDNYLACSDIVALTTRPLVDDLSHLQLDGGSFRSADLTPVDFVGSSLQGVSFEDADISDVMFDDADLTGANFNDVTNGCAAPPGGCTGFTGATLVNATLTNADFSNRSFDDTTLDGAILVNGDFSGASFEGTASQLISARTANLSASVFDGAVFGFIDLTDAVALCGEEDGADVCSSFVDVAFSDSLLVGVDFDGAILSGTSFPNSDLSGADFGNASLSATTSFAAAQIDGLDLRGVDLGQASPTLFQGKLDFVPGTGQDADDAAGVDVSGTNLSGFDLAGLEMRNWNFENASLESSDFTGVDLTGANFGAAQFDSLLDPANANRMLVDTSFFSGATLPFADLRDLDLTGYDLSGANLQSTILEGTNFENADLSGADLTGLSRICNGSDCADLTGARLSCVDFGLSPFEDFLVRSNATDEAPATDFFFYVDPDLSGLRLIQRTLLDYNFTGRDLTKADFEQGNLRRVDFTDADLHGTRFVNATLCTTGSDAECPTFDSTDLVGSTDCNDQEGANFTGVDFSNAPQTLFEAVDDQSAACVNFTNADLGLPDADATTGFDFSDLSDYAGAVIAGASLRHQDFSDTGTFGTNFFQQFGHAPESFDDLCTSEDDDVPAVDSTPDLRGTDFSCGDLGNQVFGDADLTGASFVKTDLVGVDFDGATLTEANFTDADFTDASLIDVFQALTNAPDLDFGDDAPDRVDADGVTYPNLQRVNLSFADFTQAGGNFNLNHVDLSLSTLSGARLIGVDLRDAILTSPISLCDEADDDGTTCSPDARPQTCVDITGSLVEGANFKDWKFVELFEFQPDDIDAARNFFQGVDGGNLRGVNFNESNIGGLDFSGLDMRDSAFFLFTRLCDDEENQGCAIFEGTQLGASDRDENLNRMVAIDFDEVSLAGASFDHVDLTSADLSDVAAELCLPGVAPAADDCLTITGAESRLDGARFDGLDFSRAPGEAAPFGANGTDDAVTRFAGASFRGATLAGLALHDRDFTSVDFTAADLSGVDFEGSTLESASFGCDGDDCSVLDGASLCGVDAGGARFEASLDGTDFWPAACAAPANLFGARFTRSLLATLDLSMANLEGVVFSSDVDFCDDASQCLTITGANLISASFAGSDLDELPADWFTAAGIDDLRESDFTGADASGKDLSNMRFEDAAFTGADLQGSDLQGSDFEDAQFALGATTLRGECSLPAGGTPVDLRGADLGGADFSRARHFHRGCILVDSDTRYDGATRFPIGFDLLDEMTEDGAVVAIPEPRSVVLEVAALLAIALLAARRRYTSPA